MGKTVASKGGKKVKLLRVITVIEKSNVTLRHFTNNLAAYKFMVNDLPKGLIFRMPSYATINRTVREAGDHIELPTPVGIYTVKKAVLFLKAS